MSTTLELNLEVEGAKQLEQLQELRSSNKKAAFNELLAKLLIPVGKYVKHEIRIAEIKGIIPENNIQASELMDDLLIKTFDTIADMDAGQNLYEWLFQQADHMLEDVYVEEDFHEAFYDNIDDLSQVELDAMEALITRDADGDLVLVEELDDMSYTKADYVLDDIFISDPEKEMIAHIDAAWIKEKAQRSISKIIHFLPSEMRSVYNLHHHGLDPASIAYVKRMPMDKVNTTIHKVRRTLRHLIALELDVSGANKK